MMMAAVCGACLSARPVLAQAGKPADESITMSVLCGNEARADGLDGVSREEWEAYFTGPIPGQGPVESDLTDASGGACLAIRQDMGSVLESSLPFTAVYQVDAWKDRKLVYSNAVGIELASVDDLANGRNVVEITGIPAGSEISISLAYPGPCYSLHGQHQADVKVPSLTEGKRTEVGYLLMYDFSRISGCGKRNDFGFPEGSVEPDGSFELPSTGGSGAAGIAMAGALACAAGIAMAGRYFRKRGGGFDA